MLKKPDENSVKAQKHILICKRCPPSNVLNGEGAKETQCFSFGSRHRYATDVSLTKCGYEIPRCFRHCEAAFHRLDGMPRVLSSDAVSNQATFGLA